MKLKNIEESSLFEELNDPEFAAGYLEEILEEDDLEGFLIALKNIAKVNGGIGQLSETTGFGRESMYKTLSEAGNPQFSTLQAILKALGLRFSITADEPEEEAA